MGRRGQHSKDELIALILNATEEIIISEGIINLNTRKIANKIGYTVGTLYHVFKNLNDILLKVNTRTIEKLLNHVLSSINIENLTPQKTINNVILKYSEFYEKNPELVILLFKQYGFDSREEASQWYYETIMPLISVIAKCIAQINKASLEQSKQTALLFLASLNGILVFRKTTDILPQKNEALNSAKTKMMVGEYKENPENSTDIPKLGNEAIGIFMDKMLCLV